MVRKSTEGIETTTNYKASVESRSYAGLGMEECERRYKRNYLSYQQMTSEFDPSQYRLLKRE